MADALLVKGTFVGVCATPQPNTLTESAFEALTFVEVCCLQEDVAIGSESEIVSAFCISGVEKVAVGASSGSEFEMNPMYEAACAGQKIIRDAALAETSTSYAFVKRLDDATSTTTATTIYWRAMLTGYTFGGGDVNSMVADVYNGKVTQKPIFVEPGPV